MNEPRALHPRAGLRPGGWYACEHPDRDPVIDVTAFDPRCTGCNDILARVQANSGTPCRMDSRTSTGVELGTRSTARGRLARAEDRRGR